MKIDTTQLKEHFPLRVRKCAEDERFYLIPGADGYTLSTYGRVHLHTGHCIAPTYLPRIGEAYPIQWTNGKMEIVSLSKLISMVFFEGKPYIHLGQPHFSDDVKRWKVEDLHLLQSRNQYAEYINAKIKHRKPRYAENRQHHEYVGRIQNLTKDAAHIMYSNAKARATSAKLKKIKPHYAKTTMAEDLAENTNEFYDWLLANQYYHPLGLEIDKDILTFGKTDIYSKDTMALVPRYINDFFRETRSELGYGIRLVNKSTEQYFTLKNGKNISEYKKYDDALRAGRKIKADKIREMVKKEKALGYMPSHILKAMSKWATLCERGKIEMWEPDIKIKRKMRKIND